MASGIINAIKATIIHAVFATIGVAACWSAIPMKDHTNTTK